MRRVMFAQHFGRLTDFPFARQKHQHVARSLSLPRSGKLIDRVADGLVEPIFVSLAFFAHTALTTL